MTEQKDDFKKGAERCLRLNWPHRVDSVHFKKKKTPVLAKQDTLQQSSTSQNKK